MKLKIKNFIIFEFRKTKSDDLNLKTTIIVLFNKTIYDKSKKIKPDKVIEGKKFGFNYNDSCYQEIKPAGKFNVPQRTISINILNNIGVEQYTGKISSEYPSIKVILFQGNSVNITSVPAKHITSLNPEFGVVVDGELCAGTLSDADKDLVISSDTSSYSQIYNESLNSPYQVYGNKLWCLSPSQLCNTYQTVEKDALGRTLTVPYTPFDKQSAYQFSTTIIEDPGFTLKLDGNMGIHYTIYSQGFNGIKEGKGNLVKMSLYLYNIQEAIKSVPEPTPIAKKSWLQKFKLVK